MSYLRFGVYFGLLCAGLLGVCWAALGWAFGCMLGLLWAELLGVCLAALGLGFWGVFWGPLALAFGVSSPVDGCFLRNP